MKTFTPAEQAVLQILAYAAVFGGSVQKQDLTRFQTAPANFSSTQLLQASTSLWESGVVRSVDVSRQILTAQEKWQQVGQAVQFLRRFPQIESIWVTGSLAVGNIQSDDDIDLMIVTARESLWWTRTMVAARDIFARKIRRRHDENGQLQDKWCCNLWLESGSLQLPLSQRSLYSAREVIQAVPVFQRKAGAVGDFLTANAWVTQYLPEGFVSAQEQAKNLPAWSDSQNFSLPRFLRRHLNHLLFSFQKKRMQAYRRHEIVEINRAFFHPGERAKIVQQEYERILRFLGISL